MQRRERIGGNLRPCGRHSCKKGRFSGIGQADQADIGDELESQPQGTLDAFLAGIGMARRLVGRGFEMRVAEPAIATARQQEALAFRRQVADQRLVVFLEDLRANRHPENRILAPGAIAVAAHAMRSSLRLVVLLIAIVDQRVEAAHRRDPDIATLAAIAAIGTAELDELLAPEGNTSGAAVARADKDPGLVEEFHLFVPWTGGR